MTNIIETLDMTPEEEMEVFLSIGAILDVIDPKLNLNAYLRAIICEVLNVPEDTPDDQLNSNVHDILPVYIEHVRKDYDDCFDIDAFVEFIVTELRAGRLQT